MSVLQVILFFPFLYILSILEDFSFKRRILAYEKSRHLSNKVKKRKVIDPKLDFYKRRKSKPYSKGPSLSKAKVQRDVENNVFRD